MAPFWLDFLQQLFILTWWTFDEYLKTSFITSSNQHLVLSVSNIHPGIEQFLPSPSHGHHSPFTLVTLEPVNCQHWLPIQLFLCQTLEIYFSSHPAFSPLLVCHLLFHLLGKWHKTIQSRRVLFHPLSQRPQSLRHLVLYQFISFIDILSFGHHNLVLVLRLSDYSIRACLKLILLLSLVKSQQGHI